LKRQKIAFFVNFLSRRTTREIFRRYLKVVDTNWVKLLNSIK